MKRIKNLEKIWRLFFNFTNRREKRKNRVSKNRIVRKRKKAFLDLTDCLIYFKMIIVEQGPYKLLREYKYLK